MPSLPDLQQTLDKLSESDWKEVYLEHARRNRDDVVPFPADEIQEITNNLKGERTAKGAISILDCVLECVGDVRAINQDMRVLDYGCGWGRMTRLLPFYFAAQNITGADVDERLVDSAQELLPYLKHVKIDSMQRLPFADESFDVVFANSVFSHLSREACRFTLRELSRVLAKGGVLVISVLEAHEMDKFYANEEQKAWITNILGEEAQSRAELQEQGFVWGSTGRWPSYGIAIVSDDWIRECFATMDIDYRATRRREVSGTHNYKVGVKV